MRSIYLDHNATTRLHPVAQSAMAPFLDTEYGNPSSIHRAGRAARDAIEQARDHIARLVGATAGEVVITTGGTKGDTLAVFGLAEAAWATDPRRTRVVASPLEHPAVLACVAALGRRGFRPIWLPVDGAGRID